MYAFKIFSVKTDGLYPYVHVGTFGAFSILARNEPRKDFGPYAAFETRQFARQFTCGGKYEDAQNWIILKVNGKESGIKKQWSPFMGQKFGAWPAGTVLLEWFRIVQFVTVSKHVENKFPAQLKYIKSEIV